MSAPGTLSKSLMFAGLLSVSTTLFAAENTIAYPAVESVVPFSSVTALNYATPAAMIPYGSDLLQFGLLWLPPSERRPPAQIVLIHGGCWLNAYDIQHTYALSTALAQAGYAVWSLEYRRTGDNGGGWPWTFEDIKAGIAHVHPTENFVEMPTIVMGHSAGGHLALLAGALDSQLKGVVGLGAITDIVKYSQGEGSCQSAAQQFMGGTFENRTNDYHAANPVGKTPHPNTVLLHGSADEIVPIEQSAIAGAKTVIVEGAGHFDWTHPGSEAFQVLLQTLEDMLQP
ncbi:MAG: alpha/beta fold hydrolase [Pseudohongiella sp.]|nr:alpha/beta fold hydrolase [Pseudohongiella sp.]